MSSEWIDSARYAIAVLFVVSIPPAIAYWFLVHPFVAFWRRLGVKTTFWIIGAFYLASIAVLFLAREPLVGRDLGGRLFLLVPGVTLYGVAVALALQRRKLLTFRILAGAPELSADATDSVLLSSGIYALVRHPRYLEFMLGGVAWALLLNYSGVYLMMGLTVVAILVIVPLEERELRDRFGQEYVDYCARVPRYFPRLRRPS